MLPTVIDFFSDTEKSVDFEDSPPHLVVSPIRKAYRPSRFLLRSFSTALTGLLSCNLGVFLVWAAHSGKAKSVALPLLTVDLCPAPPSVYNLQFKEPDDVPIDQGGGGSGSAEVEPESRGDALQIQTLSSEIPLMRDMDEATLRSPGLILTDGVEKKGYGSGGGTEGGSGGGAGGGNGGGFGPGNGNPRFLSSFGEDGITLDLENMDVLYREYPTYPSLAKLAHFGGRVVVETQLSPQGIPIKMTVVSSPHEVLTREVLRVLPQWRFKPIEVEGRKVRVRVRILFIFTYPVDPKDLDKPSGPTGPICPAGPKAGSGMDPRIKEPQAPKGRLFNQPSGGGAGMGRGPIR